MSQDASLQRYVLRRLSRRRLLRGASAAAGLAALGLSGCSDLPLVGSDRKSSGQPQPTATAAAVRRPTVEPAARAPGPLPPAGPADWGRHARLANASYGENSDDLELEEIVRGLRAQNVSVVEVDTRLSDWLTEEQFEQEMEEARRFNRLVHTAGMKVVWYYPSLEVISVGGQHGPSFYKTYPDWAQIGMDGRPNLFHGGVVFWVDPGNESVWLSPDGPWREYYLNRVKGIAQTGADGLWPDVPIYFAYVPWADTSHWARDAFTRDTGLTVPSQAEWSDPTFRRWIEWRHRNLNRFLLDIAAAGRSVNPSFETFVETVTMDYNDATLIGLDGGYLRLAEGVTHMWEVDVVSNDTGMRYATEDDWICLISMYKYGRAASGKKAAWAFSYGIQEDDAVAVMAEVLAAGCNPYEVKSPEKTAGVSAPMRTHMYAWVKANTERLFDATLLANVALYHSSASRDYTEHSEGSGLFASTTKPPEAEEWWSTNPSESCYDKQWLAEYRGTLKALVHAHIPFNVLTSPTFHAEDLEGYKVLLLPDLEAVSDNEAAIIRRFVQAGGTIVITGPDPTGLNEYGDTRTDYALADVLGFSRRSRPAGKENSFGAGKAFYFGDLPGKKYLKDGTRAEYEKLIGAVLRGVTPFVTIDGDRRIHLEATRLGNDTLVHFTNFIGVAGPSKLFRVVPTSFTVSVAIPEGKQVKAVNVTSSDNPTPDLQPVPFSIADSKVSFTLHLKQYSLVAVSWQ